MHKRIELTVFFPSIFQHLSTNNSAQQVGDLAHPLSEKYSRNRIKKKNEKMGKEHCPAKPKKDGKKEHCQPCLLLHHLTCLLSTVLLYMSQQRNDPIYRQQRPVVPRLSITEPNTSLSCFLFITERASMFIKLSSLC